MPAPRQSYQARRNELAHALGYGSFYEQRKAPKAEVARRRAALEKRNKGTYRGKTGAALKSPPRGTRVIVAPEHVVTITSSRRAFRKALETAAKKDRKAGGWLVALVVRFEYVRERDSETGIETEGPKDLRLFNEGWRSGALLDRIDHPHASRGDDFAPGDEWGALERFARLNKNVSEARGVKRVTIETYSNRPAPSRKPAIEERFIKLSDRALAMDGRYGNTHQYDWLEAEGYLAKIDAGTLTENDLRRIERHQERALRGDLGGEYF